MEKFIIEGGKRLSGSIKASGNKNAALPLLAASIMLDGALELENVPFIGDVLNMLRLLEEMGVKVDRRENGHVKLDASTMKEPLLNGEIAHQLRGSILMAAPMLSRFGRIDLPHPGGDRIGRRRLDTHLLALQQLGAKVDCNAKGYSIRCDGQLRGTDILLDEASVTATENTVMAAAGAEGVTVINNAACEPHVQELCECLVQAGAKIDGIGTNRLTIEGAKTLRGAKARIGADHIEVGSLIVLAAVTDSDILIKDAAPQNLRMTLLQLRRLGIEAEIIGSNVAVRSGQKMEVAEDFRGAIPKIEDAPWPGFPADMTSIATVAASQTKGSVIIFEKLFESRMFFVDQLIEMGARIVLCDPHRAVVIGPSPLRGREMVSPDIRAGMALLIAGLAAEGKSSISSIEQIDRGYERIDERLRALGASIERVQD